MTDDVPAGEDRTLDYEPARDDESRDAKTDEEPKVFQTGETHGNNDATLDHAQVPESISNILTPTVADDLTPSDAARFDEDFETFSTDTKHPAQSLSTPDPKQIGDYQILGELGRGGMGVVYKARHRKLNRIVALKMILAGEHSDDQALQRFISEARAVAHLQHPGIVQIFDIGEHNGLPYFSLEYVPGSDLKQALAEHPQSPRAAAEMVEQLCLAMQYAHDHKILHRDIKPANILLDQNNQPKITDFGLAKNVDAGDSTSTRSGTIMGSPSYMPPEQARGESSSVTARSDLYSLGAVLYQMLTGRPPFLAQRPLDTILQVIHNEPVTARELQPGVPVDLETICMKAMQKPPDGRYANCNELAADLRRFLNNEPILARPVGRTERLWRWCKRNPFIAIPSTLAATAIITTAIVTTLAWQATAAQAKTIAIERDSVAEQRDEAERQRIIANEAQAKAEDNAALAQKQAMVALQSIQFVVTEIDDLLADKPQMTDVRISLMEALSKKWDEIDLEMAGGTLGEAIPTLMAVRHKLAHVFQSLDRLEEADAEFEKLYKTGKQRVKVKNGSDLARSNLAKIAHSWADVRARTTNDSTAAAELLKEALAISRDIKANPGPDKGSLSDMNLRGLHASCAQGLAVNYLNHGDLRKAAPLFNEALNANAANLNAIRSADGYAQLTDDQKDTATAVRQLEYDRAALALANIQQRLGSTDEAIALYEKAISARREIYERRPQDASLKKALSGFLSNFGRAWLWLDRPADASPLLEEAVKLSRELYEVDPDNVATARAYGQVLFRLGTALDELGKPDEADKLLESSRDVHQVLVETLPDARNTFNLMLVEARLGNADSVGRLFDELVLTNGAVDDFSSARVLAQLADHAAESEEQKKDLIDAALTALESCVEGGYSDRFRIQHENDLAPLRDNQRFKVLVQRMKKLAEQ